MTSIASSSVPFTASTAGTAQKSEADSAPQVRPKASQGALAVYALPNEAEVVPLADASEPVPELDLPWMETLPRASLGMVAAAIMQQLASDQLLDNLMAGVQRQRELAKEISEKAVKQIEEDCKKAASLERKQKAARAIGWVKAIGSLVVATAICVAACVVAYKSGGLAGKPLMYAGIMAMQSAIAGVMAMSDPEFKGYYVGEVGASTTAALEQMGMDSDDASKAAIAVAVLVGIYAGLSGGGAGLSDAAQKAQTMGKVIQIINMLFSGSVNIAQGANNMAMSEIEHDKAMLVAMGKELERDMAGVQKLMDMYTAMFPVVSKANNERNANIADDLKNENASMLATTANFG